MERVELLGAGSGQAQGATSRRLQVGKPVRQVSGKGFRIQMSSRRGYSDFIQSLALAGTIEVFTHSEMPNPLLQASVIQTPALPSIDVI